jgi:hypothetical protein
VRTTSLGIRGANVSVCKRSIMEYGPSCYTSNASNPAVKLIGIGHSKYAFPLATERDAFGAGY